MADVKWIKFMVGTFDGASMKKIKRAKIAGESFRDKLEAIWFELLDLAGKRNNNGKLVEELELAIDSEAQFEDIATMIDRDIEEVKICINWFIQNRMICLIDDLYALANWNKYQETDKLEHIREQNRLRQKAYYDRQKALEKGNNNVNLTLGITQHNALDIDKEEDIDINNIIDTNVSCSNEVDKSHQFELRFESFWSAYPRKVGKQKCFDWFKKNKPSKELTSKMIDTIEIWKHSEQWTKQNGQFIPMPYTWLNRGGWDDEIPNTNTVDSNNLTDEQKHYIFGF